MPADVVPAIAYRSTGITDRRMSHRLTGVCNLTNALRDIGYKCSYLDTAWKFAVTCEFEKIEISMVETSKATIAASSIQ